MAQLKIRWAILVALFILELLTSITEGIPQRRLQLQRHHQVKRDINSQDNSYQDDYDTIYDNDEYKSDNGYDEEAITVDPNIITKGKDYTVDKGTTIRLPCFVDKFPRDSYTIMWRKADKDPNKYLVVGNMIMDKTSNKGMSVEVIHDEDIKDKIAEEAKVTHRGSTLIIPLAEGEDEGQYVCIVPRGNGEKQEIKHAVSIRDPPTLTKDPANGLKKVFKGDTVTMSCYGEGRPKPTVKWHRLGKKLPDGREEIKGETITFVDVNRHHSGRYECIADNGYGKPAKQVISLDVEYAPEVEATEIFVHAATGNSVELVCNVHAHPTPIVKWFKNKMELTEDVAQLERHGNRHVLNIPSVDESDFGNYTCRAKNRLGSAKQILEISGKAGFAKFTSTPRGAEPNSFVLEWTSESHSAITLFELRWREHGETSWRSESIHPINGRYSYEWMGKHALKDLKPASRYEATIAAQNAEDWSRHSRIYHFSTFGAEPWKDPNSSSTIQPFLSNMLSSRSQILLSVIVAYFWTRWHNRF